MWSLPSALLDLGVIALDHTVGLISMTVFFISNTDLKKGFRGYSGTAHRVQQYMFFHIMMVYQIPTRDRLKSPTFAVSGTLIHLCLTEPERSLMRQGVAKCTRRYYIDLHWGHQKKFCYSNFMGAPFSIYKR